MKTQLQELKNVCLKYPRKTKVLISGNYRTGNQLLECLARHGVAWMNFQVATIPSLAAECAESGIISNNLHALSVTGLHVLIDDIFSALQESGKLRYFKNNPVNKGIVEALAGAINELRLNGITARDLPRGAFVNSDKESDIRLILGAYENALEHNSLVDKAGLILLALKTMGRVCGGRDRLFCIVSSHILSGVEREFLEKLCGKDLIVVREDPVHGLERPQGAVGAGDSTDPSPAKTDLDRLKWLHACEKAPAAFKDGTVRLFHALGYRNEAREVLRRILGAHTRIDDAEIIYSNRKCYADLIYSLCEKLGIPATFSEGISGITTAAGRALLSFLYWIAAVYGEPYLRRAIAAGVMKWDSVGEDPVGASSLCGLLRGAGIGWGRDRYSRVLAGMIEECRNPAADELEDEDDASREARERRLRTLTVLKKLCEDLLSIAPSAAGDGKIRFGDLCGGCVAFLDRHVKVPGAHDALFVAAVKEELKAAESLARRAMPSEEAVRRVIDVVSGMRIGGSGPLPGNLHVSSIQNGGFSGRGATFLLGFDESKFPLKAAQDPIVLDEERARISTGLKCSADRMAEQRFDAARLVARLHGALTVSCSAFDIREGRRAFPSPFMLRVFRVSSGDAKADYGDLLNSLGDPVGFCKADAGDGDLDETDLWLGRIAGKDVLREATESVRRRYEGLRQGLIAEEARSGSVFTAYDGKITGRADDLDPRKNHALIMSARRIETAASCPFAYFIQYVLGVKKPEEVEREPFVWLEPKERGTLLHEVFQEYIDTVKDAPGKRSPKEEKALITKILAEAVSKYREIVPPPGEEVLQGELRQLRRDVHVFLKINRGLGTTPVECEAVFGMEGSAPVAVPLADGASFFLRGRIDRIDSAGSSEYHVWDYKTGSAYIFEERGYVVRGTQLQHCLYAVAAEQLLRQDGKDANARVTMAGYLFPTEKGTREGKGGIIRRAQDRPSVWRAAIDRVFNLVGNGNFPVTEEGGCKFCDFEDVCGGNAARARLALKLNDETNEGLQDWTALSQMD